MAVIMSAHTHQFNFPRTSIELEGASIVSDGSDITIVPANGGPVVRVSDILKRLEALEEAYMEMMLLGKRDGVDQRD